MCGIAGRIEFDGAGSPDAWLKAACTALAHRGPDAAASHHINDGGTSVAYAHRRLRVIDLDPSADQPMHNRGCVRAGRATPLTIVFNGEIYNYQQLRRDLANAGHVLDTRSDTEAILPLYEELRRAPAGHVRVRHLGSSAPGAILRPRSPGQEAVVLPARRPPLLVRVRSEGHRRRSCD